MNLIKNTFQEYLSDKERVSASDIKLFLHSPRSYYFEKFEKKKEEDEEQKRHFIVGSALHELILEPHLFEQHYCISRKFDMRTKKGKEDSETFANSNQGKVILYLDEVEMINNMAQEALKNETFKFLIKNSTRELTIHTEDEGRTGLGVRLRPDVYCNDKPTLVDLKTCLQSDLRSFRRDVFKFGYDITAAYYIDFSGKENYVFAASEKEEPYQFSLFTLSEEIISAGRMKYRMGLELLKWCKEHEYWPDYNEFELMKRMYQNGTIERFDEFRKEYNQIEEIK